MAIQESAPGERGADIPEEQRAQLPDQRTIAAQFEALDEARAAKNIAQVETMVAQLAQQRSVIRDRLAEIAKRRKHVMMWQADGLTSEDRKILDQLDVEKDALEQLGHLDQQLFEVNDLVRVERNLRGPGGVIVEQRMEDGWYVEWMDGAMIGVRKAVAEGDLQPVKELDSSLLEQWNAAA
ncbi:MAG: hypothetical protein Q7S96_00210 [bacterium]|nr:hypothetical protein [bacterium]